MISRNLYDADGTIKNIHGGLGCMLDDAMAGFYATYSGAYPFRIPGLQLAVRRVIIGTF